MPVKIIYIQTPSCSWFPFVKFVKLFMSLRRVIAILSRKLFFLLSEGVTFCCIFKSLEIIKWCYQMVQSSYQKYRMLRLYYKYRTVMRLTPTLCDLSIAFVSHLGILNHWWILKPRFLILWCNCMQTCIQNRGLGVLYSCPFELMQKDENSVYVILRARSLKQMKTSNQ